MDLFSSQWEEAVLVLTEAVDSLVTIQDFLEVSENHILEDLRGSMLALKERDLEGLASISQSIEARTVRIAEVIRAEVER